MNGKETKVKKIEIHPATINSFYDFCFIIVVYPYSGKGSHCAVKQCLPQIPNAFVHSSACAETGIKPMPGLSLSLIRDIYCSSHFKEAHEKTT